MISLTKIFSFETAHRISNYNGACSNIHGHSYKLHVTITGTTDPQTDMIFDFKQLKSIVEEKVLKRFDHALVLKEGTTDVSNLGELKILLLSKEPTAETMLEFIQEQIRMALPEFVKLQQLVLFETETSYATWNPWAHSLL